MFCSWIEESWVEDLSSTRKIITLLELQAVTDIIPVFTFVSLHGKILLKVKVLT